MCPQKPKEGSVNLEGASVKRGRARRRGAHPGRLVSACGLAPRGGGYQRRKRILLNVTGLKRFKPTGRQ